MHHTQAANTCYPPISSRVPGRQMTGRTLSLSMLLFRTCIHVSRDIRHHTSCRRLLLQFARAPVAFCIHELPGQLFVLLSFIIIVHVALHFQRFRPGPHIVRTALASAEEDTPSRPLLERVCKVPTGNVSLVVFLLEQRSSAALRRHLETHDRSLANNVWVCCGVLEEIAGMYEIRDGSKRLEHKGQWMVGGCGIDFSRKDSLIRHLKDSKEPCAADLVLGEALGWFDK
ncbi:hypothetical protein IEO21_04887 [Rhodonia placenta]|uniref:Uncharacterized protein n=1 Tax=Rhodonia placenta TaxID=104341 RepID=A0A8H7U2T8_9APHY|nr:hypothetical protein IEO21_04887 [Postia placenta]